MPLRCAAPACSRFNFFAEPTVPDACRVVFLSLETPSSYVRGSEQIHAKFTLGIQAAALTSRTTLWGLSASQRFRVSSNESL
jgi:hypothetical protein